jgi:hypothetical protein
MPTVRHPFEDQHELRAPMKMVTPLTASQTILDVQGSGKQMIKQ